MSNDFEITKIIDGEQLVIGTHRRRVVVGDADRVAFQWKKPGAAGGATITIYGTIEPESDQGTVTVADPGSPPTLDVAWKTHTGLAFNADPADAAAGASQVLRLSGEAFGYLLFDIVVAAADIASFTLYILKIEEEP